MQDRLLVPGALAEELLQGLVGVGDVEPLRQRDAGGHRLDALAVAVLDQAAEVDAAPGGLAGAVEVVAEAGGVVGEPVEDVGVEFGGVGPVHTPCTNRTGRPFVGANGLTGMLILSAWIAILAGDDNDDKECVGYSNICGAYNCYPLSGHCDDNKPFDRLSQDALVLGHCYPGSGSCAETTYKCISKKYDVDGLVKNCAAEDLMCTDIDTGHMGCK